MPVGCLSILNGSAVACMCAFQKRADWSTTFDRMGDVFFSDNPLAANDAHSLYSADASSRASASLVPAFGEQRGLSECGVFF